MSLVKWLRKNNSKLMAVVVIVIMFGFVGGSYLSYLGRKSSPLNQAIAYYLDDIKITQSDLNIAQNELEVLKMVGADELLRAQDIEGIMLAELLFTGKQTNRDLVMFTRQIITRKQYRIGSMQISDIYQRSMPPSMYWLLLKNEAKLAGLKVGNSEAAQLVNQAIPVLFKGATYPQLLSYLLKKGTTEEAMLDSYSNLLAVLQYCRFMCSNEDVTSSQIALVSAYDNQPIDSNLVKFDPVVFAKNAPEPDEKELQEQFEKYKTNVQQDITDDNPFGLGYKLPARVQLEYIAIRLGDAKSIIRPPSQEEIEGYYQMRKARFTRKVPSDPNDPNSPEKEEVTSFAEVAQLIADELTDKLIYAKADEIMQQARVLSEIKIFEEGLEPETMTSKQFEKCASDYNEIAEQIRQDYNLKVYVGKTGMLSPGVMDQDKYLATMTLAGYGYYPVRLAHAVFAIDELKLGELGVFDTAKPRMFENIGPARDILAPYLSKLKDPSRQICAIVRIIKAEKSRAPESIDESFKTHSFVMDANDKSDEDIYSVRKLVEEDVKKLGMMETTKSKAGEFIKLTKAEGWDKAIEKFNELYPIDANEIIKDPNAASFTMETLTGLRRSTEWKIQTLAAQNSGYPTVSLVLQRAELERIFADKLYNLLPTDSSSVSELEEPFEFKPSMCYFCVKDLSVDRLWKENFNINRPLQAYGLDTIQTQSLSIVHLNPSNIEKRMKFKWAQRDEDTSDSNTPDANMADVSAFDTSVPEADAQDNEPMDSNAAGRAEGQM